MTPTYSDNPDYDIDSPPTRGLLNKLVQSVRVDTQADADVFGGQIAQSFKFATTGEFGRPEGPMWILVWESVGVEREDGSKLVTSETLPLKTKDGSRWLGKGQAPVVMAEQFQSLGVSGSWSKVGQPDSAVGRTFSVLLKHKPGKGQFDKTFRIWPTEIKPEGFVFDGEVRTVGRKDEDTAEAPSSPASLEVTFDTTLNNVAKTLIGTSTRDAIDTLMDARIPGNIEGVPVLDAAFKGIDELVSALGGRVKVEDGFFIAG